MGMRTPHWKSTFCGVSAANEAAARERRKAKSSTAERRACRGTGVSLGSRVWGRIVEQGPGSPGPSGRGGFEDSTRVGGDFPHPWDRRRPAGLLAPFFLLKQQKLARRPGGRRRFQGDRLTAG